MKSSLSASVSCYYPLKVSPSPSMHMPTTLRTGTMSEPKHFILFFQNYVWFKGYRMEDSWRESPLPYKQLLLEEDN